MTTTSAIADFGFTPRELHLLMTALNGVGIPLKFEPTTEFLTQEIQAAAESSHQDVEEFGGDLGLLEGRNPEAPFEYQDLAEKISKLPNWKSAAICFWVRGFFDGQSYILDKIIK